MFLAGPHILNNSDSSTYKSDRCAIHFWGLWKATVAASHCGRGLSPEHLPRTQVGAAPRLSGLAASPHPGAGLITRTRRPEANTRGHCACSKAKPS